MERLISDRAALFSASIGAIQEDQAANKLHCLYVNSGAMSTFLNDTNSKRPDLHLAKGELSPVRHRTIRTSNKQKEVLEDNLNARLTSLDVEKIMAKISFAGLFTSPAQGGRK